MNPRMALGGFLGWAVFLVPVLAGGAERYLLETEGPKPITSLAVLDGDSLIVTDAQGERSEYLRDAKQDTSDGKFHGYYCKRAKQFVRWPTGGEGLMYVGAKKTLRIEWRESRMRVHRST